MPIYDYLCSSCEHRADILHGINDEGPKFCPSCGAEGTMRKQFSAPSIHFKGSGWAKKDRGGGGNSTKAAAKGASSSSESSGGSNGSGESSGSSGESSGESASSSPSTPSTSTSPDAKD